MPLDLKAFCKGFFELFGDYGNGIHVVDIIDQYREFIAAEPGDKMPVEYRLHPLGDLFEQGITDRVTEGIVDRLEIVEIKIENRDQIIFVGTPQRNIKLIAKIFSVRQIGQRVVQGDM